MGLCTPLLPEVVMAKKVSRSGRYHKVRVRVKGSRGRKGHMATRWKRRGKK